MPAEPTAQAVAAQPPAAGEEAAEAPTAEEQPLEPAEEAPTPGPQEPEVPNPNEPAQAWAQCGGTTASQNATVAWPGPSTCVENSTCVWLSSTFSQVSTVAQMTNAPTSAAA